MLITGESTQQNVKNRKKDGQKGRKKLTYFEISSKPTMKNKKESRKVYRMTMKKTLQHQQMSTQQNQSQSDGLW